MAQTKGRGRRRTRGWLIFALVVVVAIAAFFAYRGLHKTTAAKTTYTTAVAQTMTLTASVSGTGNVNLSSSASVTPQVSGTVSGLSVAVDDAVKEGQVLFTIVNPQLDIDVSNAQNAYDKAELAVAQANLGVQQAELSYDQTVENYENQSTSTTASPTPTTGRTGTTATTVVPSITGIDPTHGPAAGGFPVTITGTNLNGVSEVKFGSNKATDVWVSGDGKTVTCTAPASPDGGGVVAVSVSTSDHRSATSPIDFTYDAGTTTTSSTSSTTSTTEHKWSGVVGPAVLLAAPAATSSGSSGGTISTLDIKAAKQAITNAQLAVTSAQLNLDSAQVTLQNAQTAAAERTVTAPISGTITALSIANGDSVGASSGGGSSATGSGVMTITNVNMFQVVVTLAETDVVGVKLGQQVVLTFDALPNLTLTGKVTEIDVNGTNSQGVVSYNVTITPDVGDASVKGGMSVTANIITQVATDVLAVPNAAVKSNSSGSYVQILQNGQPQDVTVQTGLVTDSYTQITSGLSARTGSDHGHRHAHRRHVDHLRLPYGRRLGRRRLGRRRLWRGRRSSRRVLGPDAWTFLATEPR